jgi:type IV pilus assembly protein PilM
VVDWKKEVKLSDFVGGKKKQKDATAPEAVEPVEQADRPEQTSIWKKELSFGRKKQPKAEPVEDAPEVEAAPALEPDRPAAVELVQHYAPSPVAAHPHVEIVPDPVEQVFPVAVPDLEPETPVEFVDLLAAVLPEPLAPEPAAVAQPPAPAAETPAPPAPVVEPPAPPPTSVAPVAEAVVVHPPVSAAELPPLPDEPEPADRQKNKKNKKEKKEKAKGGDAAGVPFYKRDLSFGRKPKAEFDETVEAKPTPKTRTKRTSRTFSIPRPAPRAARGAKRPKRIVGLKIGASQLAAATVSNNGHAEVLQLAREPLDAGIVSNGELREPELLAEALKEFFKRHKLPKRGVRLGIATNRIGVRTLEISGIEDAKQLANAIKFRAQEALPIPIDEAVLDYQVLSETRNEEGESTRRILLVLAYRDLIDRYVAACQKAGIQLVGIDLEAFALLRAMAAPRDESTPAQAALVAVTVGHDRTTFAVSDGRTCEFTRVLDWGGHTLDVGLARALDLAPSEVGNFKRALSLTGSEVPEGLTADQAVKAREALNRHVQSFARELVSSLQFYQNQPGSLGIGEIVLTGGTAHLGGFAEELGRLIGVRVRVGDPLVRVKVAEKLREPEQLGSLSVAIGLGIED